MACNILTEDPHANTKAFDPGRRPRGPLLTALKETLVRYEVAAARYRKARDVLIGIDGTVGNVMAFHQTRAEFRFEQDRLVACWRDVIHDAMKQTPTDYSLLHQVMNAMDEFLNRAKD